MLYSISYFFVKQPWLLPIGLHRPPARFMTKLSGNDAENGRVCISLPFPGPIPISHPQPNLPLQFLIT